MSEAQKRFLRRKFAKEKDEEKCCDCPGCATCKGFVRNCKCDIDLGGLRETREAIQRERRREQLPAAEETD